MLEDTHKMYLELAEFVPNWTEEDKSELIRQYCKLKDEDSYMAEYYMAAVMCRYWPKIQRFYLATPKVCTYEDVYDWLVTSILETIQERAWTVPTSGLYEDPRGPDKAVNIKMKCYRLNFLIYINREKRKTNIGTESFEGLHDSSGDIVDWKTSQIIEDAYDIVEYKMIMEFFFKKKLYSLLFVYDCIMNMLIESPSKIPYYLGKIDEEYLQDLSIRCGISYSDILIAYSVCLEGKSKDRLQKIAEEAAIKLKQLHYKGML